MNQLNDAVRDFLKEQDTPFADVEKVTVDRDRIVLSLYARDGGGRRIRDDDFNDFVTYSKHIPMDTSNLWWI